MNRLRFRALTFLFPALLTPSAHACPLIGGLIDYNCDGKHKIAVVGDSVVSGIGDQVNGNRGGYVLRAGRRLPESDVVGYGKPGASSSELYRALASGLSKRSSKVFRTLTGSDVIIVDVGRNDYWDGLKPENTVTTIRRIISLIEDRFGKLGEVKPLVYSVTLIPTARGFQQSFVGNVTYVMSKIGFSNIPAEIFFHRLSPSILSWDGVHPSSTGYDKITSIFVKWVKGRLQTLCAAKRADIDQDGVYDQFETAGRFGTDPDNPDTDGDSYLDGQEIFEMGTDPLVPNII